MVELIRNKLADKKVVLLGFGREGRSSYALIRKVLPQLPLVIADQDESFLTETSICDDPNVNFKIGKNYLAGLEKFDVIIKSPGISLKDIDTSLFCEKITSQTDLFLQAYSTQVIGVTGTKGKSTTSSLIHHILVNADEKSILIGNIGRPAFDCIDEIDPDTHIVFEMSSHQLEYLTVAPNISVLLNLYQEHLDAYASYNDYKMAKMNILLKQNETNHFIYNGDDQSIAEKILEFGLIRNYLPFSAEAYLVDGSFSRYGWIWYTEDFVPEPLFNLKSKIKLKGNHNVMNIMAAINVCKILGVDDQMLMEGISGFTGLEHRLEYVGFFHGIHYYNDSIATIPEATMEAVKALGKEVDTIILGGFDRGIDYQHLAKFLSESKIRNFIFMGDAGIRIMNDFLKMKAKEQHEYLIAHFDDFLKLSIKVTKPSAICLLSPAAASYNEFPNFEIRGKRFKELVSKGRE